MKGLRTSDHTYINTHTSCISRGSGLHIHCGVEVTELSTNKQHSLALIKIVNDWNVCQDARPYNGCNREGPQVADSHRRGIIFTGISRGFGWRIHCGVKVTESSTSKQHTHSLGLFVSVDNTIGTRSGC